MLDAVVLFKISHKRVRFSIIGLQYFMPFDRELQKCRTKNGDCNDDCNDDCNYDCNGDCIDDCT